MKSKRLLFMFDWAAVVPDFIRFYFTVWVIRLIFVYFIYFIVIYSNGLNKICPVLAFNFKDQLAEILNLLFFIL